MRTLLLMIVTLSMTACAGGEDPTVAAPSDLPTAPGPSFPPGSDLPSVEPGKGVIAVRVLVRADEKDKGAESELVCTGDGTFGNGRLGVDPAGACSNARKYADLLLKGPPQDRVCTEIYGGPQTARVRGTLDGEQVDQTVTRNNGCNIADWDNLQPLLGPPPESTD